MVNSSFARYVSLLTLAAALACARNYDVTWNSPSRDSSGSMPLGNGDIGLNLWVEEGGDLLFYISKTDAWSSDTRLLKVGRVRVKLTPNPFLKGLPFRQTLRLDEGEIEIEAGPKTSPVRLVAWVDANAPLIRVEAVGKRAFRMEARLEVWRTAPRVLQGAEAPGAYGLDGGPDPIVTTADTVWPGAKYVIWFHRNEKSPWPDILKRQGLESFVTRGQDPLLHRTFGGALLGAGFRKIGPAAMRSAAAAKSHVLTIPILNRQTGTAEAWVKELDGEIAKAEKAPVETARAAHRQWWSGFWSRSYIRASGTPEAEAASRGYALQRFITACAARGGSPVKFNGSIFTVDAREPKEEFDADYRRWGGPYWFQNTRLVYWPMLASGDHEMMEPLFRMYRDALPLAKARTRIYFNHDGAFFPETMHFWGTYADSNYGWKREGKPASYVENTYIRNYFIGALELVAMMLDWCEYTGDRRLLSRTVVPFADEVLTFYDQHYPRDSQGQIVLRPAQALETWQDVVNPLPDIAGLQYVLDRLIAMPGGQNMMWIRLRSQLPKLPTAAEKDRTYLLPAEQVLGPIRNSENPELYAVFPFRLFAMGRRDIAIGRETFERRRFKRSVGWTQDAIQAAYLGLTDTAARYVVQNFTTSHKGSRFPAFWGPNFDWVPDQDHGNAAMLALQSMLLQAEGKHILVLPAWPKSWDVEFKLHARAQTVVEGVFRGGKLEKLNVTPEKRQEDVRMLEEQ
jgi:alpha-L-fucosidase 2